MVTRRQIRLEILDLLRRHHEEAGQGLDLDSLAERLGELREAVKSACDALERGEFVERVGVNGGAALQDDSNPGYCITGRGLAYLRVLG